MSKTINYLVVGLLFALCVVVILFIIFYKRKDEEENEDEDDRLSYQNVKNTVKNEINEMCNLNIMEMNLSYDEAKKRKKLKSQLKLALRTCASGDKGKKEYVKDYIKYILIKKVKINEFNIDHCVDYANPNTIASEDQFDMLLWHFEKKYKMDALQHMFDYFHWADPKKNKYGEYYEITKDEVGSAINSLNLAFTFLDKLECLCEKIYQDTKGNSVVDRIRDLNVDGVSGGLGGIPERIYNYNDEILATDFRCMNKHKAYEYVCCMYQGKTIHISALSFGTQRELERVVKNIYRYGACGHLSQDKGFIINDVADGSRVVVGRPNYADSWGFLVRKLNNTNLMAIEDLITLPGCEDVIELLFLIVRGFNVLVITGDQGSGKTTLLKALIGFLKPSANIRSQELIFELALRTLYPDRNIWSFKETDHISAQDGINMAKKTDCDVEILGEVAEAKVASLAIQLSQTGTKMTMSTAHPNTTDSMVEYFADSLVVTGACTDSYTAECKVSNAIRFDIHTVLVDGDRRIERITEIIPYEYEDVKDDKEKLIINWLKVNSRQKPYYKVNIMEYQDGKYVIMNKFSRATEERSLRYMDQKDRNRYFEFWNRFHFEEGAV